MRVVFVNTIRAAKAISDEDDDRSLVDTIMGYQPRLLTEKEIEEKNNKVSNIMHAQQLLHVEPELHAFRRSIMQRSLWHVK